MASADRAGADRGAFMAGPLTVRDAALACDLYEIAMAMSYWREGMRGDATFSCFVRRLPPSRGFLVAAGLEDLLDNLARFAFTPPGLRYLASLGRFDPAFLDWLGSLRFTGSVRAVPEGTPVFANEPLLEVTAPIVEAQLVESLVLNRLHYPTLVATKAARCVDAARGRPVIEFGLRRAPGLDAALQAARSAYLGGAASTSHVLAGAWLGVPVTGTMAHSYVSAFPSEAESFAAFARAFPDGCYLLVDTYDTLEGVRRAVVAAQVLAAAGHRLSGVRLDSGDLQELSRGARTILDAAGLTSVRIMASGGLDEFEIERLLREGAPIDGFGVGTKLDTSDDAPLLDMAYKLVRCDGRDVMKLSGGKETWPGPKQVWRERAEDGTAARDTLALADEASAPGQPLLRTVMRHGARCRSAPPLSELREQALGMRRALPAAVRDPRAPAPFPVIVSQALAARRDEVRAAIR